MADLRKMLKYIYIYIYIYMCVCVCVCVCVYVLNASSGSLVRCGRTDRYDEANSRFSKFTKAPKMESDTERNACW